MQPTETIESDKRGIVFSAARVCLFVVLWLASTAAFVGAVPDGPPVFLVQPKSQSVLVYTALDIPISIASTTPVGNQWWFNGVPISGPDGRGLFGFRLLDPQLTNSGSYFCIATNAWGATTSSVAVIEVKNPPPTPGSTVESWEMPRVYYREVAAGVEEVDGTTLIFQSASGEYGEIFPPIVRLGTDGSIQQPLKPIRDIVGAFPNPLYALPDGRFFLGGKRYFHDGSLDSSFKPSIVLDRLGFYLPDGGLVTGGYHSLPCCGTSDGFLTLKSDGSVSPRMIPGFFGRYHHYWPSRMGLVPHTKGRFFFYGGGQERWIGEIQGLIMIRPDGMADPDFARNQAVYPIKATFPGPNRPAPFFWSRSDSRVWILAVESTKTLLGRINEDGTVDPTFAPMEVVADSVEAGVLQADGALILAIRSGKIYNDDLLHLIRIRDDGRLDPGFTARIGIPLGDSVVDSMVSRRDGNILVMGRFSRVNDFRRKGIAVVRGGPFAAPRSKPLQTVSVEQGVSLTLTGSEPEPLPSTFQWFRNGRLMEGETNSTLSPNPNSMKPGVADFSLLASNALGSFSQRVAQVTITPTSARAGTVDPTFQPEGLLGEPIFRVVEDRLGNVVVGGWIWRVSDPMINGLARFDHSGVLDKSFSPVLVQDFNHTESISGIAMLEDGRMMVGSAGSGSQYVIREVLPDGTPGWMPGRGEPSKIIGGLSSIDAIVPLERVEGFALVSPWKSVIKFDSNFQRVAGFSDSWNTCQCALQIAGSPRRNIDVGNLTLDARNRFIVCGFFTAAYGVPRPGIVRVGPEGELDPSFDPGEILLDEPANAPGVFRFPYFFQSQRPPGPYPPLVAATGVDSLGRVILAGAFTSIQGVRRHHVARLLEDGTIDLTFDPGLGPDRPVMDLHVQADDRVLLGGVFSRVGGLSRSGVARLNQDGSVDVSFDPGTGIQHDKAPAVYSITQQRDGRVLIGGQFYSVNGLPRANVARLLNDPQITQPRWTAEGLELSLTTVEGRMHVFEYTSSLENPVWSELNRQTATGQTLTFSDANAGSGKRFFRVRVE